MFEIQIQAKIFFKKHFCKKLKIRINTAELPEIYENFVDMIRLTITEEDALKAIWATGEGNIKDILGNMEPPPPYTTLASTIKKLERNGLITGRLIGNTYLYKSNITESAYKKSYLKNVVETYFGNSYKNLVNFFAAEKDLTPKELRDLAALIENKNNDNK